MTTGIENLKPPKEPKGRGPNRKPRMVNTSIRLPAYVVEYYRQHHPYGMQAAMREVLIKFVNQTEGVKNGEDE